MSAVIHFEIHANDVPRAVAFYQAIFGWEVQDWSEYAGMPYFGVVTRPEGNPASTARSWRGWAQAPSRVDRSAALS